MCRRMHYDESSGLNTLLDCAVGSTNSLNPSTRS